ncbi:hypothetical protein Tcan_01625, partial [Toxocara canis]
MKHLTLVSYKLYINFRKLDRQDRQFTNSPRYHSCLHADLLFARRSPPFTYPSPRRSRPLTERFQRLRLINSTAFSTFLREEAKPLRAFCLPSAKLKSPNRYSLFSSVSSLTKLLSEVCIYPKSLPK